MSHVVTLEHNDRESKFRPAVLCGVVNLHQIDVERLNERLNISQIM